jgi:acetyltransferase-like isoleucine patch superfamily enzyme
MGTPTQRFDIAAHKLWSQCEVSEGVYISDMVRVRGKLRCVEVCTGASIADFCVLLAEAHLHVGPNARINYQTAILAHDRIKICGSVKIGVGVKILAGVNTADGWIAKPVEIGTGAVISAGAIILPGAIIPPGAFIGAGVVCDANDSHR